jgi:surface protein
MLVKNYNFININTKLTQNMQSVFYNNRSLVEIDISKFDTSNVTNLRAFFCYCVNLTTINNLENLDTSRNTTFRSMFYDCNNLKAIDLSTWDVGNVTDMRSMFNNCNKLSSIGNVSNWNTKNLVIMTKLFDSCAFTNLDLSGWITDKVTNMEYLFGSDDNKITSLTSLYIDRFNFNNVIEMGGIFHKAENLSYIKINDGLSINLIIEYLPDRTSTSTGTINVTGDKTNINTEALLIKNWNIV